MLNVELDYNDLVVDHFRSPKNAAAGPCNNSICGEGGSVASGAWIEFQLEVAGRNIQSAKFRAYGCPHTIALASWLTERLVGETLQSEYTLDKKEVTKLLELPAEKMRSVLVAEDALRACSACLERGEQG